MKKRTMTITIKRSLKANNRLRKYLEDNMWFRRKIYNKCVELYREWETLNPETRGKFDRNMLYRKLREYVITKFDYSYYCTGIIDKCLKNSTML